MAKKALELNMLPLSVRKFRGPAGLQPHADRLAVEEPLLIRIKTRGGRPEDFCLTMRTPGSDFDLVRGLLFNEGVIEAAQDLIEIRHCGPKPIGGKARNTVQVELADHVSYDAEGLQRRLYSNSSCGVCGKASIKSLRLLGGTPAAAAGAPLIKADVLARLPAALRGRQPLFAGTGGIHAAGLFKGSGRLIAACEDVGRHNALDKLIGSLLPQMRLPLADHVLLVSGRTSFELLQKAVRAGLPIVAAVGAPSSLAFEVAAEFNLTLIGFLRPDCFNIYCGDWRIDCSA